MEEITIEKGMKGLLNSRSIRETVFVEEQGFREEFDQIDETAWHLIYWHNGEAMGTARAFAEPEEEGCWHVGRVAVHKKVRGTGIGARMMAELEAFLVREEHAVKVVLSSQLQAREFYAKQGYQAVGDVYLDEHCPHIRMEKKLLQGKIK